MLSEIYACKECERSMAYGFSVMNESVMIQGNKNFCDIFSMTVTRSLLVIMLIASSVYAEHKSIPLASEKDGSWEKYVPNEQQETLPWTGHDDIDIAKNGANLLEGDQESFSFARDHKGPARLFQCSFRKDFAVDQLNATQCSFKNVWVRGPSKLRESSVQGDIRVEGHLSAHALNVQGNIDVKGPSIRLRGSTIQGDFLISDSVEKPATLYLDQGTIAGNIHFKSGKGTLLTKGKALIEGNVTGLAS